MVGRPLIVAAGFLILLAAGGCSDQALDPGPEVRAEFARKVKPPPTPTFAITGLEVAKLDPTDPGFPSLGETSDDPDIIAVIDLFEDEEGLAADFFGCPDATRTCNKLTLTFEGSVDLFRFSVAHNAGQLFYSEELTDRTQAGNGWHAATPILPMAGKNGSLTVYWQGQRRGYHYDGANVTRPWSVYPDLDAVGLEDDQFVFSCSYQIGDDGKMCGRGTFADYPNGWAEFTGGDTKERAFVVIDAIELVIGGGSSKPKKNTPPPSTYIRFDVQAFGPFPAAFGGYDTAPDYLDENTLAQSIEAFFKPVIATPSENTMILARSSGADPDSPTKPNIEKEQFSWGYFTDDGCHVIDLRGVYVHDTEAWNTVWDRATDLGDMALPIWVDYVALQPSASTFGRGATCPPRG